MRGNAPVTRVDHRIFVGSHRLSHAVVVALACVCGLYFSEPASAQGLAIAGAVAIVLARRGMALLAPSQLAPTETITTLKEDKEWLKQRLTSGATSS